MAELPQSSDPTVSPEQMNNGGILNSVIMQSKRAKSSAQHLRSLTDRERQIVTLVCAGHSNKIIARKLQVKEGTIKTHLHAIYVKLGIENRASLIVAVANAQSDKKSNA
jgi:DNA-binding NarL/FixJ family response regulator